MGIDAFSGFLVRDDWYLLVLWSELKEVSAVETAAVVDIPGSESARFRGSLLFR